MNTIFSLRNLVLCGILFSNFQSYATPNNSERAKRVSEKKVITTPSGLKIEILEPSKITPVRKPTHGKRVTVHYTGWLMLPNGEKGKSFDSSHNRGLPFSFNVGTGKVIKGWDEGIALLTVGDKARLTIPAELGYGNRSIPGAIPANSTLIFDVELVDVE
jgi:peptidylprolyl isomerase